MIRMFDTHKVRVVQELSGRLWDFTPLTGEYENRSMKVMVPSCIETYPGFGNFRGWAAYETNFEAQGNIRLEFKGVSHFARVFVDDQEVVQHYGSYTPFSVCLRDLDNGSHRLKVLVDNEFREEYALDMPNDYMSYGGISRGVVLEKIGKVYISYIHVTPISDGDGNWYADVEIACDNLADSEIGISLEVMISDTQVILEDQKLLPGMNLIFVDRVAVSGVQPWDMEHPRLYEVEVSVLENGQKVDDLIDRVGFRTVEVKGKQILLNGRALRIKGFCRHEDHPHYGCALPAQSIANDLQLVKDMGGNSIRTSHYPNDELFLDMCDELGILVWEENHARGIETEQMQNVHFESQCEQTIHEMITAHYNHPAIYIWGIMNECGSESEYGRTCYQAQFELIRKMDKSRPCTYASCKFNIDICQDLPDVCSWNIYPYWYEEKSATQKVQELTEWIDTKGNGAGKPFMISEVGAGGIYAFRDTSHDVWSEELQAEILKKQVNEIFACESCVGLYIWQFCDVRVSRIDWAIRRPKSRNNKGIVDEYRRPKLAYHEVKEAFGRVADYR